MKTSSKARLVYAAIFSALLITEVIIALFVRDSFIRPYGGDILVTPLLCCFVRIFIPCKARLLPLCVFVFSVAVEFAQYINIVKLLGLSEVAFFRIIIGTSFSWIDVACYGVGCLAFWGIESLFAALLRKNSKNASFL